MSNSQVKIIEVSRPYRDDDGQGLVLSLIVRSLLLLRSRHFSAHKSRVLRLMIGK